MKIIFNIRNINLFYFIILKKVSLIESQVNTFIFTKSLHYQFINPIWSSG